MYKRQVLPAMAALVVLSACASEAPKVENKAEQTAAPTVTDKTVVYTCNKKTVTAVLSLIHILSVHYH